MAVVDGTLIKPIVPTAAQVAAGVVNLLPLDQGVLMNGNK